MPKQSTDASGKPITVTTREEGATSQQIKNFAGHAKRTQAMRKAAEVTYRSEYIVRVMQPHALHDRATRPHLFKEFEQILLDMGDSNVTLTDFLDNYGKEQLSTTECDTAIEAFVAYQMQRAVAKNSTAIPLPSAQHSATTTLNQLARQD